MLAPTSSEGAIRSGVLRVRQVKAAVKVDVRAYVGANGEGGQPA